uniref:RNA helicase n=1 Tax=Rhabditophanes sp. KR3021 TaxID=114890 RepID=A0AC35TTG4_9BILA
MSNNLKRRNDMAYLYDSDSDDEPEQKKIEMECEDIDEIDPLDAYMSGITEVANNDIAQSSSKAKEIYETGKGQSTSNFRCDLEDGQDDSEESYYKYLEKYENQMAKEDTIYEYDEDGNIIHTWKKKVEMLEPVKHNLINYEPFVRDVYDEHEQVKSLTCQQVFEIRKSIGIQVFGKSPPNPVVSFGHLGQNATLLSMISQLSYEKPTPIQCQAIPAALAGRDVLGIAQTGSGKTLAYILPAILHILNQDSRTNDSGPVVLIVAPTRELALQIYSEAKKFGKPFGIKCVCAYGGGVKYEQAKALEGYVDLVVCTPGRIIDLLQGGQTNLQNVTFLVFDEADRMFDCGFEPQVTTISDQIRLDRQCLMFSATFKSKIEKLALKVLCDPIKIICGELNEGNADVTEHVLVLTEEYKFVWLKANMVKFLSAGKLIIFVTKKTDAALFHDKLRKSNVECLLLHGDLSQFDRNERIGAFKKNVNVLVATDVCARGLDIPHVGTVLNYTPARDFETHLHRIGRTGRAGKKGDAYTLLTQEDKKFAIDLVKHFENNGLEVCDALMNLALTNEDFAKDRQNHMTSTSVLPINREKRQLAKEIKIAESASKYVEGMDKASATRSVYAKKFAMSFVRASEPDKPSNDVYDEAADPRPEWKKRLEERVAQVKADLEAKRKNNP